MTLALVLRLVTTLVAALLISLLAIGCAATPGSPQPPVGPVAPVAPPAAQPPAATAVVLRSPTCACCHEHEEYMRHGGFEVNAVVDPDVGRVKDAYGVPHAMYSCHTTDVNGYFVEGHVPLDAILDLLSQQPDLDGIALPGMPAGSPGMGGVKEGPLTVYGIRDGEVVGVFGTY